MFGPWPLHYDRAVALPIALTIAGSDSSGSAGLQADLPTFAAFGVHGTSVITVITAQNSREITAFHQLPAGLVADQLDALIADIAPHATKTGLIRDEAVLATVAERRDQLGHLVIDPVCTASDGSLIVSPALVGAYRELASSATIFTPNLWEIELLLGLDAPITATDVADLAPELRALGADVVVVTGGRGHTADVVDVVVGATDVALVRTPRIDAGGQIRGTGCTLSAAATALLAQGESPADAVAGAHRFVQRQLSDERLPRGALRPGGGRPGVPHVLTEVLTVKNG